MKTSADLGPITVTASRLLRDGSPDPCADPNYAGTQYCLTRRLDTSGTPESPAEWNARRLAEDRPPLEVTVTRGRSALPSTLVGIPAWAWFAGLMVLALTLRGRYDRR